MTFGELSRQVIGELGTTLASVQEAQASALVDSIVAAERVFLAGAGRSGLAIRACAMRLMHAGVSAHVIGETTTPGIGARDLLLIGSGSGATGSLVVMAEKARRIGATIALVTIDPNSAIARLADVVLVIPAPTPKLAAPTGFISIQPMGSLFEQSLLLTLDIAVMLLMQRRGLTSEAMFSRHANLE